MKINNYDEIFDELVDMLIDLDVDMCQFQIDIYLYIRDDGSAYLYQFTNPGGNSWLNDDHILLCSNGPHYDDYYEGFTEYDENGYQIPYTDEDLRNYLEECRGDYNDMAYLYFRDADIEST